MPEGQSDRAALKHSQGAVPDLKASRGIGGTVESHVVSSYGLLTIKKSSIARFRGNRNLATSWSSAMIDFVNKSLRF